jgi:phthiodiolone/phenolphthiodiolone dimycocerosates ketoreductase
VTLAIGAGELRQTKPFGYKRSQGLKRLEDVFSLIRQLIEAEEPITYEGHHWHYKNATMGHTLPERMPEFWALGGGPTLLDIAARYADGFEVASPQAFRTADEVADVVKEMRDKVEGYGRDPDEFGFGIWNICVCHDDPDVIDQVLDNPLVKYFAGQFGRLNAASWRDEGFEPVMPDDWHYAMKWAPFEQTQEEIDRIVSAVPREMARKAFHVGSPSELAELNKQFAQAGVTFFGQLDMTPLVLGPEDGPESIRRTAQISEALKSAVAAG